jgi:hypothetical protein
MLSQTPLGEITIGDSQECGLEVAPFGKPEVESRETGL